MTRTVPDVEVTMGGREGRGVGCFFGLVGVLFLLEVGGVSVLTSVFYIFSAAEQMVAAILIARVSLSGTTERKLSCDL